LLAALTLIALRVLIGFHFFNEGLDKFLKPKPFSSGFFENSKGPLSSFYRSHIWDPDGLLRLGYKPAPSDDRSTFPFPSIDMSPTKANWKSYRQKVSNHYGFNDQQEAASQKILAKYERLLDTFVDENREEIVKYFQGVQRRERDKRDPARRDVASLRSQATENEMDLRVGAEPWSIGRAKLLAKVDALWKGIEREMNDVAGKKQRIEVKIDKIGRSRFDSESIDKMVPWFDMAIGACLVLGLFTRIAGILGAAFLAMVVSSQWPGAAGALPTWPQAIECIALLHLAAIGAGRYGGLDGILRVTLGRCCRRKQGT